MAIAELLARWSRRADELAPYAPYAAEAFRRAAGELEAELRSAPTESLSIAEASARSGFHRDSLGRMLRRGTLKNVGTAARPRVLVSELPTKAAHGGRTVPVVALDRTTAPTSTLASPTSIDVARDALAGRIRRA